jgi:hypothetical protein
MTSEQEQSSEDEADAHCFVCGDDIHVREDEWWSHSWSEEPALETVEEAIDEKDFRDWFRENKILCSDCHKQWIRYLQDMKEAKNNAE